MSFISPTRKAKQHSILPAHRVWSLFLSTTTVLTLAAFLVTTVDAARLYVPAITAVMTDAFVGGDGDGKADPGETIRYTAVISNSGTDATGVTFDDTIDANTTLSGAVSTSPVAVSDGDATTPLFTVTGNVGVNTALFSTPFSVVANDYQGQNMSPGLTISAYDSTSAQGGQVTMVTSGAGMGRFTYDPPTGYEGLDTFTYTLSDNTNASTAATNRTATVTINVSGMIWFINNTVAPCIANGCGRLSNPYSTLAAFNAVNDNAADSGLIRHPQNNDNIFIYESATAYAGGITLLDGQKLIGQDSSQSLSAITGLTPITGSAALPSMNTGAPATTIQNGAGNAITIGEGNTIRGLTVSGTSGAGIIGSSKNALTVGADVQLTGVSGADLDLSGGNGTVAFGATVTNTAGRAISIANRTGGTISLTGAISDNGGTGISLANNTGATINFSGALTLSTGTNTAFSATGGGTISATNTTSTVTTTTATAINVTSTTIGASNLNFRSVSSSGGSATGIILTSTGSTGALMVLGDGTTTKGGNGSGGTITNKTGGADGNGASSSGVYINNGSATLKNMTLTRFDNYGLYGLGVNNVTLQYSTVGAISGSACADADGDIGTSSGSGDAALVFGITNPSGSNGFSNGGTLLLDNLKVYCSIEHQVEIYQQSGTFTATISNSDIKDASTSLGGDGIQTEMQGTANGTITVDTINFDDSKSQAVQGAANDTSTLDITVKNSTLLRSTQGNEGIVLSNGSSGDLIAHVTGNNISGISGVNIFVGQTPGNATASSSLTAYIANNTIDHPTTATNSAIIAWTTSTIGAGAPANVMVTANTVTERSTGGVSRGIFVDTPDASTNPNFSVTVLSNLVHVMDGTSGVNGIAVQGRQASTACFDVRNNTVDFPNGNSAGILGIRVRQSNTAVVNLEQGGSSGTAAAVLAANNTATAESFGTVNVVGNSTCANPPVSVAPNQTQFQAQAEPETVAPIVAATTQAPETFANETVPGRLQFGLAAVSGGKPRLALVQPAPAQSGETIPTITIGTLPAGKSVKVVFDVTVDASLPQNKTRVLNQAVVSGSNFSTLTTSESPADSHAQCTAAPSIGGQTCTPVDLVDLSVSKSNDTSNTVVRGTDFTWQIQVSNVASSRNAVFTNGQVVLEDHLPGTVTYDSPSVAATSGVIGLPNCSITSNVLTCTAAAGGLTIPSGEGVVVAVIVHTTSAAPGPLVNPTGGVCKADPNTLFAENSTANNTCSNTVTVTRPNTTILSLTRTDSNPNNTSSVGWQIVFANPVGGLAASNFSLVQGGSVTGATIDSIGTAIQPSEPDTTWNITVNTGSGDGTLGLNFVNDTGMNYAVTTTLPYVGQVYTIDKTGPTVTGVTYNSNTGCLLGPNPYYCNAGDVVQINVAFNEVVNVNTLGGTPSLSLNSGGTAAYLSGTSSNTLVFEYTVAAGQNASDLDYTSTNALALNGGTIQDAALNNATLTLVSPGASGSLGNNANVVIDTTAPTATNFNRFNPATTPTNADTLIWQAVFSESIDAATVNGADFTVPVLTGETIGTSGSGTTYNVTVSGGDLANFNSLPLVDLDFAASPTISDLAGNSLTNTTVGFDQHYSMDNTGPTVSMSSAAPDPTNTSPIPVTVTFSESMTGFTAGDITAANGTVNNFVAVDGDTYTFDLTPSGQGLVTADIAAGVAQDDAGNNNTAAPQFSRTYDSVAPTVSIDKASSQADPTGSSPINFTVTFSEPVSGFDAGDFLLSGGAVTLPTTTAVVTGGPAVYNVAVSNMTGDGTVIVNLTTGMAVDAAGNSNGTPTVVDDTVLYDTVAPSVTIVQKTGQADPTSANPIEFTVTFSESVTDFDDLSDVTLSGTATASVTAISGSGTTYNVQVTATSSGTVIAAVPASVAIDGASQANSASPATGDRQVTFLPPVDLNITKTDGVTTAVPGGSVTYTITASNAGPNNAPNSTVSDTLPASLTATWTCVGAGGGTCTAAGAGNINDTVNLPVGASVTYTVSATISASATGSLSNTATVSADASVNDTNSANNAATDTDTLTPQADLDITKTDGVTTATPGGSVTYTITASNAGPSNAPGSTVADTFPATLTATWTCVGAGGGTCTASGSGNINDSVNLPAGGSVTYTVSGTISASATGTLSNTATVTAPGGVTDAVPGNNSATDSDTLTPQANLSITKSDGVTVAIPGGSLTYTITASNAGPSDAPGSTVADTFPADLTVTSWTCVGAGGGTCTAAGSGNINDTVNLPAGGSVTYTANADVSISATGTISNTATVATPGGVTDPTPGNNSATDSDTIAPPVAVTINQTGPTDPTSASPVHFTVVFGSAVTGFATGDVTLTGTAGATTGTVTEISPNNGTTYDVAVTGMTGPGTIIATISAGVAQGSLTEPNAASTSTDNTVTYDAYAPDTTITANPTNPTNSTSASFSFTGNDGGGVGVAGFECQLDGGGFSACSSPRNYAGPLSNGSHTFQVRAKDSLDNTDATPASYTWTIDLTAPTVSMSSAAPDPTNTSPIPVTVTFSESVTGFTSGDITAANGTVSNFAGSGASYTFDLTPSGQGVVTADIAAGVAQDSVSNGNIAASQFSRTYDTVSPSVSMSSAAPDPTNTSPIAVTVTFSESVSGFTAGDITTSNGLVSNFAGSGASYTFDLVPSAQGVVTADIAAGVAQDAAGNPNTAATQFSRTYDSDAPTTVMNSAAPDPTNTSPIAVTVTFSESVTGFVAGDITTSNGTISNFAGSGTTYTFDLTPSGQGLVTADIAAGVAVDSSANGNTAAAQFSRTYDTVAPTVSMSSVSANPTNVSPIPVTVTFSQAVTGFASGDITTSNGTVSNFAGSGASYTFDLTPSGQGLVTADIAASVAQDLAGNNNTAASQFSRTYDSIAPTVTIEQASGQADPTSVSPINFTATFSEAVTGFTGADITLSGTAGATTATVTEVSPNNGTTYNVAVSGMTSTGTVIADVNKSGAQDAATNLNDPSTSIDNTVTVTLHPTTTTLGSGTNPSVYSQSVTLTATVTSVVGTPTGTVEFFNGVTSLGTSTLSGGIATLNVSTLSVGTHSITAQYAGAAAYLSSSTASPLSQVVNQAASSVALTSNQNPSAPAQSVTFTAVVSGVAPAAVPGTPTGTVTFTRDSVNLTGCVNVALVSRTATCVVTDFVTGSYNIQATYSGDSSYLGSQSSLTQNVSDVTPPQTTILSSPARKVNKLSATFTFASSETPSTFECSLDGKPFTACTSPKTYVKLSLGWHKFQVRAIDRFNNVDATPASISWEIQPLELGIPAIPAHDGSILEKAPNTGLGGAIDSTSNLLSVGDDATNRQSRAILSFNTASIPDNAIFTTVLLRLKMEKVIGSDPLDVLGDLLLDVQTGFFGTFPGLQATDFNAASSGKLVRYNNETPQRGYYYRWFEFPTSVQTAVSKTGLTQMRLRFETDSNEDGKVNMFRFYSGEEANADWRPFFDIFYVVP